MDSCKPDGLQSAILITQNGQAARPHLGIENPQLNGDKGSTQVGGSWDFAAVQERRNERPLRSEAVIRGRDCLATLYEKHVVDSDRPLLDAKERNRPSFMVWGHAGGTR